MKGCTSKCLLLDTEGVIVSPSADPPFNGGLSGASHAKVCVALLYSDGCTAEWPKCFTPAPNLRVAFTALLRLGVVKSRGSKTLYKIPRGCSYSAPPCKCSSLAQIYSTGTLPCMDHSLQNTAWLLWPHSCSCTVRIHHTENQCFSLPFFFAPTTSDWHCTEMQNNNPLIT